VKMPGPSSTIVLAHYATDDSGARMAGTMAA
jgi:hypothetical protein